MQQVEQEKLDIKELPEQAKKELLGFYESLVNKYKLKKCPKLPRGFYNPIKVDSYSKIAKRDEIYDR